MNNAIEGRRDETFDNQSDAPDGRTNAVTTDDYHDHYDYDLNGNRVDEKIDASADGGTGSAAVYDQVTSSRYDARNELTSETQTTVATGTTVYSTHYLYDANGSILSSTRTGSNPAVTTYTNDARNRILTVSSGGSTTAYTYNDDGILVQQAVAGGDTTTYLIDANNPTGYSQVLEVRKNGSLTTTYTLGKTIVAQNSSGAISYIMPDGHGSTRQLTAFTGDASNGHVTARYDYDAFGNPIALTATTHAANTASTYVMYVSMLLDPITGNYRTESREYAPADGRFFWQDSYMPAAGDLGNVNLYAYVGGNPINGVDPSGHGGMLTSLVAALGVGLTIFEIRNILLFPSHRTLPNIAWTGVGAVLLPWKEFRAATELTEGAVQAGNWLANLFRVGKAVNNPAEVRAWEWLSSRGFTWALREKDIQRLSAAGAQGMKAVDFITEASPGSNEIIMVEAKTGLNTVRLEETFSGGGKFGDSFEALKKYMADAGQTPPRVKEAWITYTELKGIAPPWSLGPNGEVLKDGIQQTIDGVKIYAKKV